MLDILGFALVALFSLCHAQHGSDFFLFASRPDIGALKWDIQIHDKAALQQGYYWFISPYLMLQGVAHPKWQGPHIYDENGQLIWSGAGFVGHSNCFDFRVNQVDGEQMLSFIGPPLGRKGNGIILDSSYQVHEVVDMVGKNHTQVNIHELNLREDGRRALMAIKQEYKYHTVIDIPGEYSGVCRIGWQGFKEVDVKTGEVLFEWNTRGNIDLNETNFVSKHIKNYDWKHKCANEWDITHINAVDKFDDGDYLISARHTDTLYKISHKDRSIVWRLGGSRSDFVFKDPRAEFSRQHHARFISQNDTHTVVSLFDNAVGSGSVEEASSETSWGLLLALRTDVTPMEVELIKRFEKPHGRGLPDNTHGYSPSRGSLTFMPNGNAFINWVYGSHLAEYSPNGTLLMSAVLSKGEAASYRAFKMPWIGRPAKPPDVVARTEQMNDGNLRTIAHVSWNGDTEVRTWNILHTNLQGNISELVASAPRDGFETSLTFNGSARHIVAVGLDSYGMELGRSKVATNDLPTELRKPSIFQEDVEWVEAHSTSQWEPSPSTIEGADGPFTPLEQFIAGVSVSVVFLCAGLCGLWLRRRAEHHGVPWWKSQVTSYKPVHTEEEEQTEAPTWLQDEKSKFQSNVEDEESNFKIHDDEEDEEDLEEAPP